MWKPRRATFSVRIERRITSTVKPYATMQVSISGRNDVGSRDSSKANTIAVSGERMTPASTPAMQTSGHSDGLAPGSTGPITVPSPAPMMRSGASTPPDVPDPSAIDQMMNFTMTSESATPHPVQLELAERVLAEVDSDGQQRAERPREQAGEHAGHEAERADLVVRRHREQRTAAEQERAHHGGDRARQRDRDQASRAPLEQQQLHREEHRRDRRVEHRRHACRSAGDEQRLALGGGQMEVLRDERPERAARHDDRALGAERPAAADDDPRRERLQDRNLQIHPALAEQDRLERFGDAVAADLVRTEASHQADDQPADR